MPCLTTWAAFLLRSGVAHVDNVITKRCSKQSHGCSCQGCQATNHTGTLPNLPNSASGTYAPADRLASGTSLRNLPPEPAPARAGTLRNPPQPSGIHNSTHRNPPAPSGTCLRNLHQHTPEPPGTFRNLPPEPTPAHTGTLRNLPEPSFGTCSCDPHRHTPELIWAEDPISLRCWGKMRALFWLVELRLLNFQIQS